MPPVSAGAFARLFDGLDAQDRREFVADLYAARGWTVREEDDHLHVERDGEEQRVAIVEPSRFRSVRLPDADEVVVTRDREGARSAAAEAGATYRTPADLRDLLLYGVDRETARELFEAYFERPLEVAESGGGAVDPRRRLAGVLPSVSWDARRAGVAVAVLLVVAVWAGSAGVLSGLGSEPTAPEVNGTYTPGAVGAIGGEREYPPGLGPEGIENARELTIAHFQFLDEKSHAYRVSASGPQHAPFMLGLSRWNATVRIRDETQYRYEKTAVAPYGFRVEQHEDNETVWEPRWPPGVVNNSTAERLTKRVYANGTEKYWWYDGPEREVFRRASVEQQGGRVLGITDQVGWVDLYLQRFLRTPNSSISCRSETETGTCQTYRVEATGEPIELRADVTDYRAVAVVDQPGFVRSLTVSYEIDPLVGDGEPEEVRFRLEYVGVGDESGDVSPPAWLPEAKNRTSGTTESTEIPTVTENESSRPPP